MQSSRPSTVDIPAPLPRQIPLKHQILRMVCPECHAPLMPNPGLRQHEPGIPTTEKPALVCLRCDTKPEYPLIHGEIPDFRPKGFGKEAPMESYIVSKTETPLTQRIKGLMAWPVWLVLSAILAVVPNKTSRQAAEESVGRWVRQARADQKGSIFNIYLKAMEAYHFFSHVPTEPSLEFGGNWGNLTNTIYSGVCRITFSSEYLGESFFSGNILPPQRHDVFDSLLLSEAHRLPIPDGALATVLSMHILDHIIRIDDLLAEVSRTLKVGGVFYASTYGQEISLPEFVLTRPFGALGKRYRRWRLRRPNPRGGDAYQREGIYPTGQNLLSLDQWRELARRHGLELDEVIPFNRKWIFGLLMDVEYQGIYCPPKLWGLMARLLLRICGQEAKAPPAYADAFNVFLVFRKV